MPAKRKSRSGQVEVLTRSITVRAVDLGIFRFVDKRRGESPTLETRPCLHLRGKADEPLGGTSEFLVQVDLDDRTAPSTTIPPAIGAIISLKPEVSAVLGLEAVTFDRLWVMAAAGHLRWCRLAFTRPKRRSSLIVSVSFASGSEEDDERDEPSSPSSPNNSL